MIGKKLPAVFWIVFAIWVILQVCLVVKYWDMPNHDDARFYAKYATECIETGTWYPAPHNQYDLFIFGPGYVNLLIGIQTLFGSFSYIRLLNLLLNMAMVFEILLLARRLFNDRIGYYASILYMLVYSNLYIPIAMLTDLPFTFLLLTALLLCTSRRLFPILFAGVIIGLANWFRPLAVVFLFAIIVHFIVQKRGWRSYVALFMPLLLTVFLIGQSAKARTGHFVYQAVSGGYNLAMSSFDEANGLVNFNGFSDPDNYICLPPGDYTYMERDSLLKRASIRWISEHPFEYISQIPLKLVALYSEDTWTERVKPDMGFRVVLSNVKGNNLKLIELIASLALKSVVYYAVLLLFLYYVWKNRRDLFRERNIYLLIPALGTVVTVLFVITSRYHYPYLFAITIYAAAGLDTLIQNKLRKNSRKC
ncbi:glycosyltransferase family 39 protein [uncultured Parabacteroides sp.]|jgi:4-amino-4-deoxy-L-arabinose transferase-like glycosyltransferase|uniref:glycosyltransferase family 39 protein n=1 Tax=uncultured Parabacteroides sp. TaxID=512312 RepID=UPI0025E4A33F|nr:glycosyltransferase family 39 protein [uncultured Parabacteroides sp.]